MSLLGQTARFLCEQRQMTQRSAAEALGVSYVHLSNVERGKTEPSTKLLERFKILFGADLHVVAWCFFECDVNLPEPLRMHRQQLAIAWKVELARQCSKREGVISG
jgi:transcriptional regulator with XRE-family HTH domain